MEHRSPRILIICFDTPCQSILTLPLLNTLRAYFPQAYLVWLTDERAHGILAHHPAVDETIVFNPRWFMSPSRVARVIRQVARVGCDIIVDPQSNTVSSFIGRISGASRRIGFGKPMARGLANLLNNELTFVQKPHIVDRTLELLTALGIRAPHVTFELPEFPLARARVNGFISDAHLRCGFAILDSVRDPLLGLWSPSHAARVARYLGQRHSVSSVITWTTNEDTSCVAEIVEKSGGHAFAAPSPDLAETATLLRSARVFVGPHSEILHLAAAVGAICVGIHESGMSARFGCMGPQHISVEPESCNNSANLSFDGLEPSLQFIDVERICEACDAALAKYDATVEQVA